MIVFEDLTFISMADVGKAASIFLTIKKSPNMSEKINEQINMALRDLGVV